MLIFVIAVGAVMLPIILGGVLALGTSRLDVVVAENKEAIENRDKGYNPALTLGHKIKVGMEPEGQLQAARLLAAQKAASQPRGSNMRIGRLGQPTLKTAGKALNEDPWTAVKIAQYHGWDGAKTGAVTAAAGAPGAVVTTTVAAPAGPIKLTSGKDYEHVEIMATMSGAEKRQARIANAKAKSKAYKAAKATRDGAGVVMTTTTVAAAAPAAVAQSAAVAMPTGIPEPNYIEITDDMSPDDLRKARIHNSKEKSKYNKALKAAGFDPEAVAAGEVEVPANVAVPAPEPAVAVASAPAAAPVASGAPDPALLASIPAPDYIEITDGMSPDEVRQARIHNSKARSAYNKALKAAGIDPSSLE